MLLKAKVAPERRKVWKVYPGPRFNFVRISEKWRLTLVSVKGTQVWLTLIWNRGKLEPLGVSANILANAVTGQRMEFDILGTVMSLISLLFCMVLDQYY